MKTVYKPWGKEEWLELNDKYCYKRIYINKGHKTSLQYHEHKKETNYLIKGEAEVWIEEEDVIQKKLMREGQHITIEPSQKHRFIAMTDIILQEVSTPEVDDIIRVEDDTNRKNGLISHEHQRPALCIVAAGIGSRLRHYSEQINKALLPIDNKAVISHIIDKTPKDYDVIMIIGYKGEMVETYCKAAHPDRNFIFVPVEGYDRPDTGARNVGAAENFLQRPFIFAVADCYIDNDMPLLDGNWLGVYPTSIPEMYSTANVKESGEITEFSEKSSNGFNSAFIGIAGIYDYEAFWANLAEGAKTTGEMASAFYNIPRYGKMTAKFLDWYDVGTVESYLKACQKFNTQSYGISKDHGEFLYKVDGKFIKIFADKKVVENKLDRADILHPLTPEITYFGKNLLSYNWVEGKTLYEVDDENIWNQFLQWYDPLIRYPLPNAIEYQGEAQKNCELFYKDKTYGRLNLFADKKDDTYGGEYNINGTDYKSIDFYLDKLNWDEIIKYPYLSKNFHGDLQFDNIIYDKKGKESTFTFIDWRDSFGNSTAYGDILYDLAKLYGGLLMPYNYMKDETNYSIRKSDDMVEYSFKQNEKLLRFAQDTFLPRVGRHRIDRIMIRTALIYLNMAPLHHNGLDDVLFFHSIKSLGDMYDNDRYRDIWFIQ